MALLNEFCFVLFVSWVKVYSEMLQRKRDRWRKFSRVDCVGQLRTAVYVHVAGTLIDTTSLEVLEQQIE